MNRIRLALLALAVVLWTSLAWATPSYVRWGGVHIECVNVTAQWGIDNTGATDAGVQLQRAFTALAASNSGQAACIPAGTYQVATQVLLPSGLHVEQSPGATIVGNLDAPSSIQLGTLFYAAIPSAASTTTLNGNPTVSPNSNTIVTTVGLTAGTYIQIVSVASPSLSAIYYVESTSTFTASLDHAMLYPFVSGDTVNTLSSAPPSGITWHGNRGMMTGKGVGFIGGAFWNSEISGIRFSGITGTHADYIALLQYGSYSSTMRDLYGDATGARTGFNAGFADSGQSDLLDNDSVTGPSTLNAVGIKVIDARAGTAQNCQSSGLEWGLLLGSDATITPGVAWYHVNGGNYLLAAQYGLYVGAGSANNGFSGSILATGTVGGARLDGTGSGTMTNNTFARLDVSNTGGDGFTVSAGATATKVQQLIADNPGGACAQFHDEAWIGYWHSTTAVPAVTSDPNIMNCDGGAGHDVRVESIDWTELATANFAMAAQGTTRTYFGHGNFSLATNSIGLSANGSGSVVVTDDVKGTGSSGTYCAYAPLGTLRIGAASNFDGCATAILVTSGFANRGQTAAGTAGGAAIAWPDLKSTDVVLLEPTAAVFTGWVSATTAGTGFTLKDAASGTYGYYIP